MKKILIIILLLTLHSSLIADIGIGGVKFDAQDIVNITRQAAKAVEEMTESNRSKIEREIKTVEYELKTLGQQKDLASIGDAEYSIRLKALQSRLDDAYATRSRIEQRTDTINNNVDKLVTEGAQTWLTIQRDKQTAMTQIGIAGVQQSEMEKGALQRLQHITTVAMEPENLKKTGVFLSLTAASITCSYYGLKLMYRYLEDKIGKPPSLIEESSWGGWGDACWNSLFGSRPGEEIFSNIILPATVEAKLMQLAHKTKQAKITKLNHQAVLLYGEAGTGKTMFAKMLAHYADMDYAIVYGGRITPNNIDELKHVFDWAKSSSKGMILFIDEVDAFLTKRADLTPDQRKLVATFLALTGESSQDIMIIMTCNRPGDMDPAALDRVRTIHMPLPNNKERKQILDLYFTKLIVKDKRTIEHDGVTRKVNITIAPDFNQDQILTQTAEKLEGYSGRSIKKFMEALQGACYYNKDYTLTKELFDQTMLEVQEEIVERKAFIKDKQE